MKKALKIFSVTVMSLLIFFATAFKLSFAADSGTFNYEVLKYKTQDTSIANDYFNKPAKYIKKNGKLYVQITVNHSHWITGMSIEGHKEKIISQDKAKDERTSEFEVSKIDGLVDGKIDVYINEKVNGKPFLYDHHYNITYKFSGPKIAGASGSAKDDSSTQQSSNAENPQTAAGTPSYIYVIPAISLLVLIVTMIFSKKFKSSKVE